MSTAATPPESLEPLAPLPIDGPWEADARWFERVSWMLVGLGVLVRLVRYLVDYPIWHDEAFLAASLWDRDFRELAQALEYGQVAPWMFLCIERVFVLTLGYSELTLRLFPTLCSIASVIVFRHLASRVVQGWGLVLATGVLACAFYPIRHGNEVKPYASDLLAAVLILTFAVEYLRKPGSSRWWWIGAAALPVLLGVSYPAVFVAGGVCVATAPGILLRGNNRVRAGFFAYGLSMLASFLAIYMAATVVQQREMGANYRFGYWKDSFPPLDSPAWIPVWLIDQHAGNMLAYPAGERRGGSTATLICVVAGIVVLWRRGRRTLAAVLLGPFALGLVAAFLGKYPYGGEARIMQYVAPSTCLMAGVGMAAFALRFRKPGMAPRLPRALLTGLVLIGVGLIAKDLAMPYRVYKDVRTRDFAKKFWAEEGRDAELACLKSDLGVEIVPHTWEAGMSAVYLFHQRLYSERHREKRPFQPNVEHLAADRPLRLVLFRDYEEDEPAVRRWLEEMNRDYMRQGMRSFVLDAASSRESWLRDAYGVYDFTPRDGVRAAAAGPLPNLPRRF